MRLDCQIIQFQNCKKNCKDTDKVRVFDTKTQTVYRKYLMDDHRLRSLCQGPTLVYELLLVM